MSVRRSSRLNTSEIVPILETPKKFSKKTARMFSPILEIQEERKVSSKQKSVKKLSPIHGTKAQHNTIQQRFDELNTPLLHITHRGRTWAKLITRYIKKNVPLSLPLSNMFGKRAHVYVSAHGSLGYIPQNFVGDHLPNIGDFAEKYFSGDAVRKQQFRQYIGGINYSPGSHLGYCSSMDKTLLSDDGSVMYYASEPVNISLVDESLKDGLSFSQTVLNLKLSCLDTIEPDPLIDVDDDIHNRNEAYNKEENDENNRLIGKNYWQEYKFSFDTMNKNYYFKKSDLKEENFDCAYGLQIRKIDNDDTLPIIQAENREGTDLYVIPTTARYKTGQNLIKMCEQHYPPSEIKKLTKLINKVYGESQASIKKGNEPTCTLGDILVLFFELQMDLNIFDASCSIFIDKELNLVESTEDVITTLRNYFKNVTNFPNNYGFIPVPEYKNTEKLLRNIFHLRPNQDLLQYLSSNYDSSPTKTIYSIKSVKPVKSVNRRRHSYSSFKTIKGGFRNFFKKTFKYTNKSYKKKRTNKKH